WFDGSLDDVKLYNRILTQSDVNKLFTQPISCLGAMGINEYINYASRFHVYPNPSNTGIYTVSELSGTSSEITITTLTGEVIKTFNTMAEIVPLDLKQYPSGIYFLHIKNSNGGYTQKLIKE
ncbi:MAG: T9SS type A sorting domain-containing protein, partial [Bacteroidia bacterium]